MVSREQAGLARSREKHAMRLGLKKFAIRLVEQEDAPDTRGNALQTALRVHQQADQRRGIDGIARR